MKKLVIGILAHVDAGKTTLSESMLYTSGTIRRPGRVDNKDAFLDTYELERERGITIFSKQAVMEWQDLHVTLLDTPGHVDFSAEMERALQVMDYAILVISGADGVQGHTQTLWRLLKRYHVPVFLFVNKMDQNGTDKDALLADLQARLDGSCIDFSDDAGEAFYENVAMCSEDVLEYFLETGHVKTELICELVSERRLFPCYFGSALKQQGVEDFMKGLARYAMAKEQGTSFGAKVYKVSRDERGGRMTWMKITGGRLCVRDTLSGCSREGAEEWEEKTTQLRIYSGAKYETVQEAEAGCLCAVLGLSHTYPGEGLGCEADSVLPLLEPVLTYQLILPPECDAASMMPKLRQLEEEEPQLHLMWDEEAQEIKVQLIGEVQLEVLTHLIKERFGIVAVFGAGNIVYKETIKSVAEGVGHYEPLRHYAEVHLLLEPGEPGSGMQYASVCSEDVLDRNWQRLIQTHLEEKEHRGVLTGSVLTDVKITILTGRAHIKHTEGGDFRQATYRAVRQGLMQVEPVLLEPYYDFRLELPEQMVGRAMTDIEGMYGKLNPMEIENGTAVLTGIAPAATMQGYQKEVNAYTKGNGHLQCIMHGYDMCHNADEVVQQKGYDPDRDLQNPSSSVFCAHGAGYLVEWFDVKEHMHVESPLVLQKTKEAQQLEAAAKMQRHVSVTDGWIDPEEVDQILARSTNANKRDKGEARKNGARRKRDYNKLMATGDYRKGSSDLKEKKKQKEYFLVDGYNIIFAWKELAALAEENIDAARGRLLDLMCNYQGIRQCSLIVVFDAYRVEGHATEYFDYHNIHVVYTKTAETADQYIERFAHEKGRQYDVTVATSDGLEQIIIRGQGCLLVSARELEAEVSQLNERIHKAYVANQPKGRNTPFEAAFGAVEGMSGKK